MRSKLPPLLLVAAFVAACAGTPATTGVPSSPSPSAGSTATPTIPPVIFPTGSPPPPSLSEFRHGPDGLIADLSDAGADAEVSGGFNGEPLATSQTVVCVDGQEVRVFTYSTEQERVAASAQIDPTDPSNVGTAIVSWDGWPKFWQRDRIIVLYLGRDAETIRLLTDLLGDPFAQGQDRPQMLPGAC